MAYETYKIMYEILHIAAMVYEAYKMISELLHFVAMANKTYKIIYIRCNKTYKTRKTQCYKIEEGCNAIQILATLAPDPVRMRSPSGLQRNPSRSPHSSS